MSSSNSRHTQAANRHRRLAVSLAQQAALPAASEVLAPSVPVPHPVAARPTAPVLKKQQRIAPVPAVQPDAPVATPRLPVSSPRKAPAAALPITNPAFSAWLSCRPETTWLFAGDSHTKSGQRISKGGTFPCFLSRIIRDHFQRGQDVFINTTLPHQTVGGILECLTSRVERYSPDVVILLCGVEDLQHPTCSLAAFEQQLRQLIDRLHRQGAVVIVNTPPAPPTGKFQENADLLLRLETIRNCTLESSALLVDHWECWEQLATPEFLRPGTLQPSERGCVEMARHFVDELRIKANPASKDSREAAPPRKLAKS